MNEGELVSADHVVIDFVRIMSPGEVSAEFGPALCDHRAERIQGLALPDAFRKLCYKRAPEIGINFIVDAAVSQDPDLSFEE